MHHFNSDGQYIESVSGYTEPKGMDIGPDGNLYFADNNNRVGGVADVEAVVLEGEQHVDAVGERLPQMPIGEGTP